MLKPFDKVLVRHASWGRWSAGLFSHLIEDDDANEYAYKLGKLAVPSIAYLSMERQNTSLERITALLISIETKLHTN